MTEERTEQGSSREPTSAPAGARRSRLRTTLLRVAGAVLAVLILVGAPGYLASVPGFFGRYPGLSDKYQPWSKSTHVSATCMDCHISPKPLSRVAYRARMVGEFYVSLVSRKRVPGVFATPTNASCLECHDNLRSVSPKGDLKIPHKAHVTILKMDCVQCHDFIVHEVSPEGKRAPTMAGCLQCHDGDKADNACAACHTEKSAPKSHRAEDWTIVHADKGEDPECVNCHKWTEDWCVDCHTRRPQSHGKDWRGTHRVQVEKHRSCEACHQPVFCERCHGEVPQLNYDPALKLVQ